ncbi:MULTISPECIES: glutathione binding-like protein [Afifella]|uniref:glutathione binding-like protein n=1 Tax=Afifella TaxID=643217 RepID=UPI000FE3C2D1|nr:MULTISPECIES: glutathione binding-like protein [Afifella]MCT8266474.1 glutathione S-transferase N-terminal domain-containing protein [Afifella sp. JA880]
MAEPALQLYFWPTPNGFKVTLFLEEVGVPYGVNFVDIGKGEQFQPDFLKISPNNRMPALIDHDGPGGEPISMFESGAILMYLGRKFGRFYPTDERQRVEVESWLMWQMAGFGPMLGQNHHFRNYAPEKIPYAIKRYEDETDRLYGVLDRRLEERSFVTGEELTIADMAILPWARSPEKQGVDLADFPNVARWRQMLLARPAFEQAFAVGLDKQMDLSSDKDAQAVLFGQRTRR